LLRPKERRGVGKGGKGTVPASGVVERLGLAYEGVSGPFGGGPHLRASTDEIPLVRATGRVGLGEGAAPSACKGMAILSVLDKEGEYLAIQTPLVDRGQAVSIPRSTMALLGVSQGDEVACTVIDPMPTMDDVPTAPKPKRVSRAKTTKKSAPKKTKKKTTRKTTTRRKSTG
ncbi:MAG: arginine N-succinyltransferase, partial [Phycisphaerales bacterium]